MANIDCPVCAERIKAAAKVCRFCGHVLGDPVPGTGSAPAAPAKSPPRGAPAASRAPRSAGSREDAVQPPPKSFVPYVVFAVGAVIISVGALWIDSVLSRDEAVAPPGRPRVVATDSKPAERPIAAPAPAPRAAPPVEARPAPDAPMFAASAPPKLASPPSPPPPAWPAPLAADDAAPRSTPPPPAPLPPPAPEPKADVAAAAGPSPEEAAAQAALAQRLAAAKKLLDAKSWQSAIDLVSGDPAAARSPAGASIVAEARRQRTARVEEDRKRAADLERAGSLREASDAVGAILEYGAPEQVAAAKPERARLLAAADAIDVKAVRAVLAPWILKRKNIHCGSCSGRADLPCSACAGRGYIEILSPSPYVAPTSEPCRKCNTTGRVPCSDCSATGCNRPRLSELIVDALPPEARRRIDVDFGSKKKLIEYIVARRLEKPIQLQNGELADVVYTAFSDVTHELKSAETPECVIDFVELGSLGRVRRATAQTVVKYAGGDGKTETSTWIFVGGKWMLAPPVELVPLPEAPK